MNREAESKVIDLWEVKIGRLLERVIESKGKDGNVGSAVFEMGEVRLRLNFYFSAAQEVLVDAVFENYQKLRTNEYELLMAACDRYLDAQAKSLGRSIILREKKERPTKEGFRKRREI